MNNWMEVLFNGAGIASGVISGIIVALTQVLVSHLNHKNKQDEKTNAFIVWQRDEIGKLIREVSEIRVPMIMETNEDVIQNAYHLIIVDYERVKSLLYKKSDLIAIRSFFSTLNGRYNQMENIKLGYERELKLEDSKKVLIGEIKECKQRLLKVLQKEEKELILKVM